MFYVKNSLYLIIARDYTEVMLKFKKNPINLTFLGIRSGIFLAGAVHDMVILFASVRHKGKSISVIAKELLGKRSGIIASITVLFILVLTLAGLSIAVVNAMF